jgi:hypothetical protein
MLYTGNRADIHYAIDIVTLLFEYGVIETWISGKEKFDYSSCDPETIALQVQLLKNTDPRVVVKNLWQPWYWKTKAIHTRGLITINSRKITSFEGLCGTLAHEFIHAIDAESEEVFGHGNNSANGKENTVPYYIGAKTKDFVDNLLNRNYRSRFWSIKALIEAFAE